MKDARISLPPPPGGGGDSNSSSGSTTTRRKSLGTAAGLPPGQPPPPPPSQSSSSSSSSSSSAIEKWKNIAWMQGVRRYNKKKSTHDHLQSAVALLMARKELEKKIMEVGHGSDTRLHQLQTKMKILEDQVQTGTSFLNDCFGHHEIFIYYLVVNLTYINCFMDPFFFTFLITNRT